MNQTEPVEMRGCLGQVTCEQNIVRLKGWVASVNQGAVEGFKVFLGTQEITDFKMEKNLESPDVYQLFPTLDHADQARFYIYINLITVEQRYHQDCLIRLIPIFNGKPGDTLLNLLEPSLPVPEKEDRVGVGGSFKFVACDFLGHFVNKANLQPNETVLDAGCGVGRMAYSLSYYLDKIARYEGFDIVQKWIDWSQSEIHNRYSNFNFKWVNLYSQHYNPTGTLKAENLIFPYEDEQFSFVFLTSVFTHIYAPAAQNYLQQIARVLQPGGRCLCTFFLLNEEAQQLMKSGKSQLNFIYQAYNSYYAQPDDPENAIAHSEALVMQWLKDCGLTIIGKYYGLWCGRTQAHSYQDILVLQKPA
jgi:ubiquinone/menaquinone biosynthesis C-methylase UbiE